MPIAVSLATAAVVLALSSAASAAATDALLDLGPSKDLSAPDVVRAQLTALSHNRQLGENRGIEVVFRFASPDNRAATGPLPRFTQMIESGYEAMLGHSASELGPLRMDATKAMQVVYLIARDGTPHAYVFVLSLQEKGDLRGCWMTDAVMELEHEALGAARAPEREAI